MPQEISFSTINNSRILLFSHELPPWSGGAGSYVFELAMSLKKCGFIVSILAGKCRRKENIEEKKIDSILRDNNIKINRYHWRNRTRLWFLYWDKVFLKFLKSNVRFDKIIFCNYTSNIIGSKTFMKLKVPYRIVIHGTDINRFFEKQTFKEKLMFDMNEMRIYFSCAEKVIAVSKFLENQFIRLFPESNNSITIYNGIDFNNWRNIDEDRNHIDKKIFFKKNNLAKNCKIIFCSGRMAPGKGQDILISAHRDIKKNIKNVKIIFAGSGPEFNNLKNKAKVNGVNEDVIFLGNVVRSDLPFYYSICDIFVSLSTLEETFGFVFLEAMAFSKPVVGTKVGGVPEVIDDKIDGFLIDPFDSEQAKEKICVLLKNKNLSTQFGIRGMEKVKKKFDSKIMAELTIN